MSVVEEKHITHTEFVKRYKPLQVGNSLAVWHPGDESMDGDPLLSNAELRQMILARRVVAAFPLDQRWYIVFDEVSSNYEVQATNPGEQYNLGFILASNPRSPEERGLRFDWR